MGLRKNLKRDFSGVLLALLFTQISSTAPQPVNREISASAKQDLASLRDAWCRYLHDKQLEMAMALYAGDATFFVPDGAPVNGEPAIRKLFATVRKTFNSDIQLHSKAVDISGDLAYDSGDYGETLVTTADGKSNHINGSYLMALKRGSDGKWRIVQQMWTQVRSAHP